MHHALVFSKTLIDLHLPTYTDVVPDTEDMQLKNSMSLPFQVPNTTSPCLYQPAGVLWHSSRNEACAEKTCLFRSLLLSHQNKDWQAEPHQSFVWYDNNKDLKRCIFEAHASNGFRQKEVSFIVLQLITLYAGNCLLWSHCFLITVKEISIQV